MEEIKNNHSEEVIEQRPSTKYGRTAYQEQLRREQEEREKYGEKEPQFSYQQMEDRQQTYQNWQNENPYQQYTVYEVPKQEIKDVFAYILMVLVAVNGIINAIVSVMTMQAFEQVQSLDTMAVLDVLVESSLFNTLSYISDFIAMATITCLVLDIMKISRANYKVKGLILFAVFLRPLYFVWRAKILGRKKTGGIIYAVCYYGLTTAQCIWIFYAAFRLAESLIVI